ncbi:MAG: SNF2-related protein [Acidobacteriota bacterium]
MRAIEASERPAAERLAAELLRRAPELPSAGDLGVVSSPVEPWPHQLHTVRGVVARWPQSMLFCDEVGLGKTIEVALCLRQLWISGRVRRALLLVPKAVLRQWQDELWQKAALDVPRLEGDVVLDRADREVANAGGSPWDDQSLLLASTQTARRRRRAEELLAATPWDLVVVDEAHHARRRWSQLGAGGAQPGRANRLLELLAGAGDRPGLRQHCRALYLLTATPMQVHPLEVWELLRLLGVGGRWGGDTDAFLRFFRELAAPPALRDAGFLAAMCADALAEAPAGALDLPQLGTFAAALRTGDVAAATRHLESHFQARADAAPNGSSAEGAVVDAALARCTPVHAFAWRTTRERLREYRRRGLLRAPVPIRRPDTVWIDLDATQRALYRRIEAYLARAWRRAEEQRPGLGFVLTVYRRRLTSSFFAVRRSLERRRDALLGRPSAAFDAIELDELEVDDPDRGAEMAAQLTLRGRQAELGASAEVVDDGTGDEIATLDALVRDLAAVDEEPKLVRVRSDLRELLAARERVLVFTQYLDTMDHLRDALAAEFPHVGIGCWSGCGGEVLDREPGGEVSWRPCAKAALRASFGAGAQADPPDGARVRLLLCTEAAAEGLNLQHCGVLVNVDLPWNPMRVEQRIGRIDRIGQVHDEVWIRNYFYRDTVEAEIYRRLADRIDWFQRVVGRLQPILHRVEETIERLAMTERRAPRRMDEAVAALRAEADAAVEVLDVGEGSVLQEADEPPLSAPLTPADVERLLVTSSVGARLEPCAGDAGVYRLDGRHEVTFSPSRFAASPERLELLTWGVRRFEALLTDLCEAPAEGTAEEAADGSADEQPAGVGIYRAVEPVPVTLFLVPDADDPSAVLRLDDLLRGEDGDGHRGGSGAVSSALAALADPLPGPWSARQEAEASSLFSRARRQMLDGMLRVEASRRRAARRGLVAEAASLLAEGVTLDLERARRPGLFDGAGPATAGAARRGLAAREPWTTLDRLVGEASPSPVMVSARSLPTARRPARRDQLEARAVEIARRAGALDAAEEAARSLERDASSGHLERVFLAAPVVGDRFELLAAEAVEPFVDAVPYWGSLTEAAERLLDAAAASARRRNLDGRLDLLARVRQQPEAEDWLPVSGFGRLGDAFACRLDLGALEPALPRGALVVFRCVASPRAVPDAALGLWHHPDLADPETGASLLVRQLVRARRRGVQRWVLRADGADDLAIDEPEGLRLLAVCLGAV